MLKVRVTLAVLGSLLAGCAAPRWQAPPGMTQQQANWETFDCRDRAARAYPGPLGSGDVILGVLHEGDCMRAKGFRQVR
jgi:hypothetical protein